MILKKKIIFQFFDEKKISFHKKKTRKTDFSFWYYLTVRTQKLI